MIPGAANRSPRRAVKEAHDEPLCLRTRRRHPLAIQPGVGEPVGEVAGKAARGLDLVGARAELVGEARRDGDGVEGGGGDARAHAKGAPKRSA